MAKASGTAIAVAARVAATPMPRLLATLAW